MKPDGRNISALVRGIYTEESQESAPHPKQVLYIDLEGEVEQYDILRKKEAE
jgi:putative protease